MNTMNKSRLILYIAVFSAIFLFLPFNHDVRAAKCDINENGIINESISVSSTTLTVTGTVNGGLCAVNCGGNDYRAYEYPLDQLQYSLDGGSWVSMDFTEKTAGGPVTCRLDIENNYTAYKYNIVKETITGLAYGDHDIEFRATHDRYAGASYWFYSSKTFTIAAPPTCSVTANPTSIVSGNSSTLTWSSINASSCNASWTTSTAASGTKIVSPASTTTYSMSCTGAGGTTNCSTATVTVTAAPIFNFSISVSPNSGSVSQGGSPPTATITINRTSTTEDKVISLSTSGLPTGATATLDPASCTPDSSCASTMTISTSASTPAGTYTITITGSGGGKTHSTDYTLTVTAATLSVTLTATPGSGTTPLTGVVLTADVSGTATGTINYTFYCNRNDTGIDITSPNSYKIDATTTDPYSTPSNTCDSIYANSGTYTAKVIAERGSSAAEARAIITVNASTLTCSLSATPSSGTAPLNDVDLAADVSGTATGNITYKFDCTNDGTWNHTPTAMATDPYTIADLCDYPDSGTYTAKLEATRQGVTCSATTIITVNAAPFDFSLSLSPSSGSTSPCGSVSTTVNVGLISGNSQSVSLSAAGIPNEATANFSSLSCSPNCNSTLTIVTSPATPVGTYSIIITGTGGGKTHGATYTLTISSQGLIIPTLIAPTHNAWINYDPTFQAKVTDLDLKNVRAHFNLSNNPDGIGNWTTSGTTSQWGPIILAGTCIQDWWQARTEDVCGFFSGWSSWWLVKIDKDLPISSISYPAGLISKLNFIVELDDTENCSGISLGDVDVSTDHGNTWTNQGLFNGGSTTSDFMFTGTAGQCYIFRYRVRDSATNWSNFVQGAEVCIDTSIPTAAIEYPNGWINVNSFNVLLTEDDPGGSIAQGNVDIQAKKAINPTWPIWSNYSDTVDDFTYTGQNCYFYKFRYQAKDNAGNWSEWADPGYIAQIDTGSPIVNISYPTGVISSVVFTINLSDSDDCSGVAERDLEVSVDSGTWQDYPAATGGITYTGSHDHVYKFRYRARDNANNWSNYVEGGTLELKALPAANPIKVNWTFCPTIALELGWDYSDMSNLPQVSFQIRIDNNDNFSSPILDTQEISGSQKSYFIPQDILTQLMNHTKYFWQIRTKNSAGDWSPWDVDYDLSIFFKKLESYSTF